MKIISDRTLARNIVALVDEATPYRSGQESLWQRSQMAKPTWHAWALWLPLVGAVALVVMGN